jgi:hypothetical protein
VARIGSQDGGTLVLDRLRLAEAPLAVARAAVRLALQRTGGLSGIDRGHVDRVLRVARSDAPAGRRLQFPGDREARFTHRQFRLEKRATLATKAVSSSRTKP